MAARFGHKGIRLALFSAIAAGALMIAPAGASAVRFGSNLGAAVNNTLTCPQLRAQLVPYNPPSSTCLFFSSNLYAPLGGRVTQVRVRTAPTGPTGPMQVLVMRSLFQNKPGDPGHPYFACCFVQEYGPTFTPAAGGAVTAVPTAMTVVEDPVPPSNDFLTNARGDFLALSVLDPNVVFPSQTDNAVGYSWIFPAPNPANNPAPAPNPILVGGRVGARIAIDAELAPGSGPGGGGTGGNNNAGAVLRALRFPTGGSLLGTTASIPLTCALTTACDGLLRLTNQRVAAAGLSAKKKRKKRKVRTYGRKKFSIAAGKTKRIRIRLNRSGRRKVRNHRRITLTATVKLGGQTGSKRVKFKAKKRSKR